MWSANARKQTGANGAREIAIVFESDSGFGSITDTLAVGDSTTDQVIADYAQTKIDALNAQDVVYKSLTEGPIVPAKVPPPTPSQDELDRIQFLQDYRLLQNLVKSVDAGLLAADDKSITALQVKVKSEFKPEYGVLLG